MRTFRDSYRVVIGPGAWAQLGSLPQNAYVAVRTDLINIAEAMVRNPVPTERDEMMRRDVSGYVSLVRVDDTARTVTLVGVVRGLQELARAGGSGNGDGDSESGA